VPANQLSRRNPRRKKRYLLLQMQLLLEMKSSKRQ